uniref:Wiskott-Aldrich syndrome protein family member n=1 Tax=Halisarca dujardinii TaxID=2583056 RepID=A0A9F1U423_HALDU|nr:WAVE/WASF 1 [Halisarca dujardinii]
MPLVQRNIEPLFVSRKSLDKSVKNELEGVVANTIGELIRQLSSLSKHAENLFGDLFNDASEVYERSNRLNVRIESLVDKVTKLDPVVEQVRIEDVTIQNHYKSSTVVDQQVLDRNTLSTALLETYQACDAPPLLDEFTSYRDDHRRGLTFFTDPKYFFNLWLEEQNKQIEKKRRRDRKNRKKRSNQPQKRIKKAERKTYNPKGKEYEEAMRPPPPKPPMNQANGGDAVPVDPQFTSQGPSQPPPPPPTSISTGPSVPPPPPPPPPPTGPSTAPQQPPAPHAGITIHNESSTGSAAHLSQEMKRDSPPVLRMPPPPPPPTGPSVHVMAPPPPPPQMAMAHVNTGPAPPPPPPMPILQVPVAAPPPPPAVTQVPEVAKVQAPPDGRTDLLQAILRGKELKKVEKTGESRKSQQRFVGTDVASILARRIAVEMSDSDDDSSDGEWDDDEDWDD